MATGIETRAQMDTEGVKGLLFMNGGGSVALLAFLPQIITAPALAPLTMGALFALLWYQIGLVCAIVHNRLRRKCSLEYEIAEASSPDSPDPCDRAWVAWIAKTEPCVCCGSIFFHWASVLAFVIAGAAVLAGGFLTVKGGA